MRFLKLSVISFLILFFVVTAIGLLFPSTASVSRAVEVTAAYDTVYKYLNDVKYWKLWMEGADSSTISFLSDRTEGKGTIAKIGTGQVTITNNTKDSIYTVWTSAKGNIQNSVFTIMPHARDSGITIQWFFEQKLGWYPWQRFGSFANDKILGPVMEQSLNKLKTIVSSSKVTNQ